MTRGKTLYELEVVFGDVVQYLPDKSIYTIGKPHLVTDLVAYESEWVVVSRDADRYKIWKDMSREEKGALLLAHHEGKVIETRWGNSGAWHPVSDPDWETHLYYRVQPRTKIKLTNFHENLHGYVIEFDLIDGKPDKSSVKMVESQIDF